MSKEASTKPPEETNGSSTIELAELIELANAGKPEAIRMLRQALKERPQIWKKAGDLARLTQRLLTKTILPANRFGRFALMRKLANLKAELGGKAPTPIIRLSVERIVTCWLQLQHLDVLAVGCADAATPQSKAISKRQDQAHRRYLQALKSLETLRRLRPVPVTPETRRTDVRAYAGTEGQEARATGTG